MAKLDAEKAGALLRCNKCGFCLAHCPVYKATGVEWAGARGRITLIRAALIEEELDIKELDDPVFNCLTCNACVDDCPAGVQTAEIIFNTREALHRPTRMSSWIFRKLLASPSLLQKAANFLKFADTVGLRPAARKTGLIKLIGDAGKAESMVPKVPSRNGLDYIAQLVKKIDSPKYRVAYFAGCYAANLAPGEAEAVIRVLEKHRVEVTVPRFACCGMPAPAYGEKESARSLARQNIAVAGRLDVDAIVTPCASCSSFLKDYGKLLAGDPEWEEKAQSFAEKVRDFSVFIINIGLSREMREIKEKITYHDPCHLGRYQKIKLPPRTILKSIPGAEFVELKEADACCGAAGSYALKNYDLSRRVLARKMDNVAGTGAGILVSSCPACVMQLSSGAKERRLPLKVTSIVELLDRALER